jgi:hypothetical protein
VCLVRIAGTYASTLDQVSLKRNAGWGNWEGLKARHPQIVIKSSTDRQLRMLHALYTGDEIKVKFLPARNGSPPGFLETVIRPDGRVIQISAGNPND